MLQRFRLVPMNDLLIRRTFNHIRANGAHLQGRRNFFTSKVSLQSEKADFSRLLYRYVLSSPALFTAFSLSLGVVGLKFGNDFIEMLWGSFNKGKLFAEVVPARFPNNPPGTDEEEEDDDEDDDDEDDDDEEEEEDDE